MEGLLRSRFADFVFATFFALFVAISVFLECPVCMGEEVLPTSQFSWVRSSYDWGLKVLMRCFI